MKAALLTGPEVIKMDEIDAPRPAPDEAPESDKDQFPV